jgi:hypothetical protein
MLSQLAYHGSILNPDPDTLKALNNEISKFIVSNACINKALLHEPVPLGGLGFIDINEFITSLQCGWIKKCAGSNIDCWRLAINSATGNSLVSSDLFDKKQNPILFNISNSFELFKKNYLLRNDNFMKSIVAGNPMLITDRRSKRLSGKI